MLQVALGQYRRRRRRRDWQALCRGRGGQAEARKQIVSAVLKHLECGQRLYAKKESLKARKLAGLAEANLDILGLAPPGPNRPKTPSATRNG